MKLVRLHIDHFGKLSNLSIDFSDGINVISGINESGKSTLHSFIGAMLLDMERGRGRAARNDIYSHYKPWDGGKYGGSITVEHDGENYTIIRDFGPESPSLTIIRDEDGRRMPGTQNVVRELTGGLTANLYKNTIAVGQLSAGTDKNLADELRNHIVNLKSSGAYNLNVKAAIDRLQLIRKRYNGTYDKDAEEKVSQLVSLRQEKEEFIRHNSGAGSMEDIIHRISAAEEEMGIYEDESEDCSRKSAEIIKKHGLLCKKAFRVVLWILGIVLLAALAGSVCHCVTRYMNGSLLTELIPWCVAAGCCFVAAVITFVMAGRSGKFQKIIRRNEHRRGELAGLISGKQKELLTLSEEKEREQKYQWECEQKEEELAEIDRDIEALEPALMANAEIRRETQAINLAINTMENISRNEFAGFGGFLEKLASVLIQSITGGRYQGLSISEEMEVTLRKDGAQVDLSAVSTGTLDQVYLAVRLACIGFFWEGEDMPLLLDDTFAMYDDSRLERTLTWLSEIYEGQVMIFTCHLREAEIMEVLDIPYNLVRL